jgi:hypothetical protein
LPRSIVDLLIDRAHRFRERIDLEKIEDQMTSDAPKDVRATALFTVYHLLVTGAVAEANISAYLEGSLQLPAALEQKLDDEDQIATEMAWAGTAFDGATNIIGGLSFMFVVLFFFEGFCKLVIGEERIRKDLQLNGMMGLDAVLKWLESRTKIDPEKLKTVRFLNRYRNAWHSFGRYERDSISCKGLELRRGERLPIIPVEARSELIADLLDVFLAVDDVTAS